MHFVIYAHCPHLGDAIWASKVVNWSVMIQSEKDGFMLVIIRFENENDALILKGHCSISWHSPMHARLKQLALVTV